MTPDTALVTDDPATPVDRQHATVQSMLAALDGLPAFLSVQEAGRLAGLSRSAAYRAAERGELPTVRLAGRLHVPIGALLTLMGLIQPMPAAETPWAKTAVAQAR